MERTLDLLRTFATALSVAAATPALSQGGTVTGKIEMTPGKYLAETVVYLKGVQGTWPPAQHAMDQKVLEFVPHMLVVKKGDTVEFLNHDNVAHNVYSPDSEAFNLGTFKQGEKRAYAFQREGAYSILCSIHPEMLAYVFVAQSPFAAVPDKAGRYTIKGVPPGAYHLAVWNSHLKAPEKSITVAAGKTLQEDVTVKR